MVAVYFKNGCRILQVRVANRYAVFNSTKPKRKSDLGLDFYCLAAVEAFIKIWPVNLFSCW